MDPETSARADGFGAYAFSLQRDPGASNDSRGERSTSSYPEDSLPSPSSDRPQHRNTLEDVPSCERESVIVFASRPFAPGPEGTPASASSPQLQFAPNSPVNHRELRVWSAPTLTGQAAAKQDKLTRKQWLLSTVKENFNEQMAKLVERFVSRPRQEKSVRKVPGVGRKVLVNLQDFWRRSTGEDKCMKTKDLLTIYSDSGMGWKDFQKWLTKELQFMPSCAKVTALSLDIYQKYWNTQKWTEIVPDRLPNKNRARK